MIFISKMFFILLMYSFVISGVSRFYFFESVIVFLGVVFSAFYWLVINNAYSVSKRRFVSFCFFVLLVSCITTLTLLSDLGYFYLPSYVYELYKLSYIFFFFPIMALFRYGKIDFVIRSLLFFIQLNLLVLILQYIWGVDILKYIGISYDLSHFASRNRPTGLTHNANVIGVLALFVFIFSTLDNMANYEKICKLKWFSCIVVILSSSKVSILCLLLYTFFASVSLRTFFYYISTLSSIIFTFVYFDFYGVVIKFGNYIGFILNVFNSVEVSSGQVEGRLWGWYIAFKLFLQNPLGYGFGVWGDFSSRFNPNTDSFALYEEHSDSALSHLIVEQGVFVALYLLSVYYIVPKAKNAFLFFGVVVILFVTNYGFSQSLFCLGFWLVICGMNSNLFRHNLRS